jgi:hypothetical protein
MELNFSCLSDGVDEVMMFGGEDFAFLWRWSCALPQPASPFVQGGHAGGFIPPCS